MKQKIYSLAILLFSCIATSAQAPEWQWAQSAGGIDWDEANGITTDAGGNVYVTGNFASLSVTFGSTVLQNEGALYTSDMFIVKYDSAGNVIWAKRAGGANADNGSSVTTDASGNVYVTGWFMSPVITFGSTDLANVSSGSGDIFIVKYDSAGNVLWANSTGGTDDDKGWSVTTDASRNVYVTGDFASSTITVGNTVLTNQGGDYPDILVAKYDSVGNVLWAEGAGGSYPDYGKGVTTDVSGNVYLTGTFESSSITFGSTTLTNATTSGSGDIFIVKFDSAGNVLWAKSSGGINNDEGLSFTTDVGGNVYVAGAFASSSITFGNTTLTNAYSSSADIFIVKYDSAGNALWAKSAGGTGIDDAWSIITDAGGNAYVTGFFGSASITFGSTTLTTAGPADIFIVKYDSDGNVLWAISAGGAFDDWAQSIATDAGGNIYVTGQFQSFSIAFGSTILSSSGYYDMYVAKLGSSLATENNEIENFGNDILLYPNPVSTTLSIQQPSTKESVIEIINPFGQIIYSEKANKKRTQIDVSKLSAGMYVVSAQTSTQKIEKKFLKQ